MSNFFDKHYHLIGIFLVLVTLAGGGGIIYKEQKLKIEESKEIKTESSKSKPSFFFKPSDPSPVSYQININTASQKELEKLPGIGPAKAKAIIEYRKKYGNFRQKRDIIKVKGIGEKTYQKLKNKIKI